MTNYLDPADIRTHLNLSSGAYDNELARFAATACDKVETACGPIAQRTVTGEVVSPPCGRREMILQERPVISLTTITSYPTGTTYQPSDFTVEADTGIVRRVDGQVITGPLLVTYQVGYTTPPEWAVLAALAFVKRWWRPQRGARVAPQETSDPEAMMDGHRLPPGVA